MVILMNIIGIIVEYNPLHNGHVYHFNKIKELENPDLIVAVMSSSITNRGNLSIYDKFEKTKQALNLGVDVVIELPLIYACQRADIFADKAINILNQVGVNKIYIGSEKNDISLYENAYNLINNNDSKIKELIDKGYSYKEAISNIINLEPNDMLGYSYYKSIKDNNYNIELKTILRKNSNYDDELPTNDVIASAKAIRNNLDLLNKYTPSYVYNNNNLLDENKIFDFIKYSIISKSNDELKNLFFVDEGIENKLKDITNYNSLNDYIDYLSSKRYTKTRIKRMLLYILLNIKKTDADLALKENIIRVLGFNESGKKYLNKIKKEINYYTNIKDGLNKTLDIEFKASKILDSIYNLNLITLEQKGPVKK